MTQIDTNSSGTKVEGFATWMTEILYLRRIGEVLSIFSVIQV